MYMHNRKGYILIYLFVAQAGEDEDEQALEAVEDSEDVGHDDSRLVDVQKPKCPRQAQQDHDGESSPQPLPARASIKTTETKTQTHLVIIKIYIFFISMINMKGGRERERKT
jgi:hypothetical protein